MSVGVLVEGSRSCGSAAAVAVGCVWERWGLGECWRCEDGEWCGEAVFRDGSCLRNVEGVQLNPRCSVGEFVEVLQGWTPRAFPEGARRVEVGGLSLDEVKVVIAGLDDPVPAEDAYLVSLNWVRPHSLACTCLGCSPFEASDACFIGLVDEDTTVKGFREVAYAINTGRAVWDPVEQVAVGVDLFGTGEAVAA